MVVSKELSAEWRSYWTARSVTNNFRLEREFSFQWHLPFISCNWEPRVWCSCNGLVLFNVEQHILLWNPSIRCCIKVLELNHYLWDTFDYSVHSGLCYDSSTGDYKVVLLLIYIGMTPEYSGAFVIVANLKNKQWRNVLFPYNIGSVRTGIDFQGTHHWLASDIKCMRKQTNYYHDDSENWVWDKFSGCNKIVYFDSKCDEFRELPTPEPTHLGEEDSIVGLGILDGCFCMAHKMKETEMIEVLVMEKYRMKESWVSKLFIPISMKPGDDYYYDMVLYCLGKNSRVLIWNGRGGRRRNISDYDLKKNKLNYFLKESIYGVHIGICFYVESFDFPYGCIWKDDEHKRFAWMGTNKWGRQFADQSLGAWFNNSLPIFKKK